jgi:hypothetical protein
MARSILPCKNREAARAAKVRTKRAARHAIRQDLRSVGALGDLDNWDQATDLRREPSVEIGQMRRHERLDVLDAHRPELNPGGQINKWRVVWIRRSEAQAEQVRRERQALEDRVRGLVEAGGHRNLSAAMKAVVRDPTGRQLRRPHLLLTIHDVEAFVSALYLPDRIDPFRHDELSAVKALLRGRW